jgi:hypothetical protein
MLLLILFIQCLEHSRLVLVGTILIPEKTAAPKDSSEKVGAVVKLSPDSALVSASGSSFLALETARTTFFASLPVTEMLKPSYALVTTTRSASTNFRASLLCGEQAQNPLTAIRIITRRTLTFAYM